ncbi:MAG TPA: hypothetical protein PKA90_02430 [Ignavibacteria bacterium]|nr:hypothetical protein [Ignavibacteria bacterium]HMR39264.1 hypothetical protein [Ignavibacteria bacterium]
MRSFLDYAKTTIYGGVLFLIPLTVIIYIVEDIYTSIYKIVAPVAVSVGVERLLGKLAVIIAVIFILLLICFLAGLIVKFGFAKKFHDKLDNIASTFIPGYKQMKTETIKQVDKKLLDKTVNIYDNWQTVMMKINLEWKIVFIVEENDNGFLTIFEPGAPDFLKGGTKIISKSDVSLIEIDKEKAISYLKKYGSGSTELLTGKNIVE